MLAANPTNDRLNFILKTYGEKLPRVVMEMVSIIGETVGEDDWFVQIRTVAAKTDPNFRQDLDAWRVEGARFDPSRDFVATVVGMVNELPKFKTRHRADPIFPWIATQLANDLKATTKKLSVMRERGEDPVATLQEHYRLFSDAKHAGTMLSLWYERTRPNLGEWDLRDAIKEAKAWNEEHGPIPQGEVVHELSDDWTVQKLTTQDQLSREGDVMQHCVGSYFGDVSKGKTTIYSLRDPAGRPHVTIEVKSDRIVQIQGKQDRPPAKQYEKYVEEFKEWAEENSISTSRVPKHLEAYAEALEEYGHFDGEDDDHLAMYAEDWNQNTPNAARAAEWFQHGLSYTDAELAGALEYEDVTPEEFVSWPEPVIAKITESGGVPQKLDEMIKIGRMATLLAKLADQRKKAEGPDERQLRMFDPGEAKAAERISGHSPMGPRPMKSKWGGADSAIRWPSREFTYWDVYVHDRTKEDMAWLYPAEEWIEESFTTDESDDTYVGPWFIHWFTPEQATEWWDAGVEDGNIAAELRERRITPETINEAPPETGVQESLDEFQNLKARASREWVARETSTVAETEASNRKLQADLARYAKAIAQQIAEQLSDAGLRRNRKRTSRRR